MEPHASKSTRVKPAGSLVVVMKDASFARVTGVEVRLTVLRRQTNTLNLRALVRQEDVSPERQRQRVGRADGDVDVAERARRRDAPLRRARLLRHAAVIHTRKQKTHARSVSLSPSLPRPIISRSSPDRVIDPSWIRHPPSARIIILLASRVSPRSSLRASASTAHSSSSLAYLSNVATKEWERTFARA